MPYSKNPYLPKVRREAVKLVEAGKSMRLTARHFGVAASTVSRWVKRSLKAGLEGLNTLSSRPKNPRIISPAVREKIRQLPAGLTYAKIIKKLGEEGIKISLSSLKRIIRKINV